MGVEVIYWLLAVVAVGVIVVMAIGIHSASKDSRDNGAVGKVPPRMEGTAPSAIPPAGGTPPVVPPAGGAVTAPPVDSGWRHTAFDVGKKEPEKEPVKTPPVQVGPPPVIIYQFPLESVTCVCPRCDGENNPAHRFCWICGQRIS